MNKPIVFEYFHFLGLAKQWLALALWTEPLSLSLRITLYLLYTHSEINQYDVNIKYNITIFRIYSRFRKKTLKLIKFL